MKELLLYQKPISLAQSFQKRLSLIIGLTFCALAGVLLSQMSPFFPRRAWLGKDLSPTAVGFIFAAYDAVSIVVCLILPQKVESHQLKSFFTWAVFIHGIAGVLFGVMDFVHSKWLFAIGCFLLRAIMGGAISIAWYCFVPMAINWYPTNSTRIAAYVENLMGVGVVIGPAIGAWLYFLGGYVLPFVTVGFCEILLGFIVILFMYDFYGVEPEAMKPTRTEPPGEEKSREKERLLEYNTQQAPDEQNISSSDETSEETLEASLSEKSSSTDGAEHLTVWRVMTSPLILISSLPFIASASSMGYIVVHLSTFLMKFYSLSEKESCFYFIVLSFAAVAASPLITFLINKGYEPWLFYLVSPLLGVIGFGLLVLTVNVGFLHHQVLVVISVVIIGCCYSAGYISGFFVLSNIINAFGEKEDCRIEVNLTTSWVIIVFMSGRIVGNLLMGGVLFQMTNSEVSFICEVILLFIAAIVGFLSFGYIKATNYVS